MAVFHEFCGPALCRPFFVFRVDPCPAGCARWCCMSGRVCPPWCCMSGKVCPVVLHVRQGVPAVVLHVRQGVPGGAACPAGCARWCCMSGRVCPVVLHVRQGVPRGAACPAGCARWCCMSGRVCPGGAACLEECPPWVIHVRKNTRHVATCPAGESVCLYIYLHYRTCEFSLFYVSKNALSNFKNGQKEIIFKKTRIFFSKCLAVSNKVRTFASTKINNRLQ